MGSGAKHQRSALQKHGEDNRDRSEPSPCSEFIHHVVRPLPKKDVCRHACETGFCKNSFYDTQEAFSPIFEISEATPGYAIGQKVPAAVGIFCVLDQFAIEPWFLMCI